MLSAISSAFPRRFGRAAVVLALSCGLESAPRSQPLSADPATSAAAVIKLDVEALLSGATGPFAYDPQTRAPYDLVPPLSVYESRIMLRDARESLAALGRTAPENYAAGAARADFMLLSVARYIHWVDQTHTTLPFYSWSDLGDIKLRSSAWFTYSAKASRPLGGVTAIALRAHNSDVRVEQIAAIDADGREWQFNQPFLLRAGTPRSETRFLPIPVAVAEVRIRCRQEFEDPTLRPRIFIQAGVCARPELAKQAVFRLLRARGGLRSGASLDSVVGEVESAEELLLEYQRDRRL